MDSKKILIGAALAGVLVGGVGCSSTTSSTIGQCHGVNACKGQGACGGTGHSCAGMNSCKGQGWIKATKAKCEKIGGKFKRS